MIIQREKPPIIVCHKIQKYYGEGSAQVHALRGVDLEIYQGELRMLMGPSGSGKTTLVSIIAGILTQSEGTCLVNNIDLNKLSDKEKTHYRGKHIGFVFQSFNLIPHLTCEENISIPLILLETSKKTALEKACRLLKDVGLADKIGTYPTELSGGQQQRVAIARAMVHEPAIIVCDEPTSFLDITSGHIVMKILKEMVTNKGITLIVITHDSRITDYADKIDHMEDGRILD